MQDESAQRIIACIPRLRRYARALIGERAAADDLVQDTIERGWSRISSWRPSTDMRAWLFSIMHNLHIDQLRRPSITTVELDDETPMPSIHAPQADRMQLRDMESALKTLPAEQREILLLVALEEMTYEEVSTTLGIPVGTVMSRLSRARERLRAQMEGQTFATPLKVVK